MKTECASRVGRRRSPLPGRKLGIVLGVLLVFLALGGVLCPGDAAAQTPPLTIDPQNERVGVRKTAPAYTLDVDGTVNANGTVTATSFIGDGSLLTNLPGGVWTVNGTAISYSAGNVGIGMTTPAYLLDVNGRGRFLSTSAGGASTGKGIEIIYSSSNDRGQIFAYDRDAASQKDLGLGPAALLYITSTGSVGIGTTTPQTMLHVNGVITGTQKNFEIAHPLDPAAKVLVHSSLEGPEVGVYYRGEAQLANGEAEVLLPPYFEALTRPNQRTVHLTPLEDWSPLYVAKAVEAGRFLVRTAPGGDPAQRFYWEVKAVRADVEAMQAERLKPAPTSGLSVPPVP